MHETFLYPVVRVGCKGVGGSGTLIYSKLTEDGDDCHSFVLTNHHVIDKCINIKKEWNSIVRKEVKVDVKEACSVEVFQYVRLSEVNSSNRYRADIIAYDANHDLAVLKIDSPLKFEYVSKIIPEERIKELKLYMDVVLTGCSLSHDPFSNFGQITYLNEIIEQKQYIMTNASSIFGVSGGALFLKETGELIGVPSRVQGMQLGFGVSIVDFMGFAAHPGRIYEFIKDQELHFLVDPTDTYEKAMERRKKREKDYLLQTENTEEMEQVKPVETN